MKDGQITFVHSADLHLDSPFSGLSDISPSLGSILRKATFRAFENAVSFAIRKEADLFLITGDIYDGEDRSVRAQVFFLSQLKRLSEKGIAVYIALGNHDPLSGWECDRDFPPLVTRFGAEVESIPLVIGGSRVGTVHGYSYPYREVTENIALRFAGRRGEGINIALLHCNAAGRKGHENYAPCSLEDLKAARMDYWALGHGHTAEILCEDPLMVYPGNIQGRTIRESGKKGVFYVTMTLPDEKTASRGTVEFVPCDVVRWRSEELSIEGFDRDEDFFTALDDLRDDVRREGGGRPTLLRVLLTGRGRLYRLFQRPGFLSGPHGVKEAFNDEEEGKSDFVHIEEILEKTAPPLDLDTLAAGDHFTGDFLKEVRSFLDGGELQKKLFAILDEKGILAKIPAREVLPRIEALTEEDISFLANRGSWSALSGLLEGEEGQ